MTIQSLLLPDAFLKGVSAGYILDIKSEVTNSGDQHELLIVYAMAKAGDIFSVFTCLTQQDKDFKLQKKQLL